MDRAWQSGAYRELVEAAPDAILVVDSSGCIVLANAQSESLFGYTRDELIGQPVEMLLPERFREAHRGHRERFAAAPRVRPMGSGLDLHGRRRDGSEFPVEVSLSALHLSGSTLMAASVRDVSERKRLQSELQSANEALARHVAQSIGDLRSSEQRWRQLVELGLYALGGRAMAELRERALTLLCEALGADFCSVLELQGDGRTLLLTAGIGWPEDMIGEVTAPVGALSHAGFTLHSGGPVIVPDRAQETRFEPGIVFRLGAVSGIAVPIGPREGPLGVLAAHSVARRDFSDDDVTYLQGLANLLGEATRRQRGDAELQESEQRYRGIFENAAVGVAQIGRDGRFISVNRRLGDTLGYAREELRGRSFQEVTHPEDVEEDLRQALRLLAGEIDHYQLDKRYLRRDGTAVWCQLTASLLRDAAGEPRQIVAIVIDIDARKRAEEALRALTDSLERQVQERTARLSLANQELESFNYSVSHDLRAPLRGIDGFAQVLLEEYAPALDERGRRYLERIRAGAGRMGDLIDAMLRMSRLSRGELHFREVDLSATVREIVAGIDEQVLERSIELVVEDGLVVQGDDRLLRAALENLLDNAVKFSRSRDPIRIEFGCRPEGGRSVYFLRDNGVGFNMDYADKLFVPFQRLHSPGQFEGTGIGLATVQRIIHRHGGEIWAESEEGAGTTFRFTLGE